MPAPIDEGRILDAALAVWRELGFREATTRRVAERAGVGEVTIFRRFGDKAGLFGKALETQAEAFRSTAAAYTGDLNADLVAAVTAYQALLDRNGAIVLDFLLEAPRNTQLSTIAPVPMQAVTAIAQVIWRHQSEGRLRSGEPMLLVLQLLAPLILRHALKGAQPTLGFTMSAEAVVCAFLLGWEQKPD
jgi:AcrR family transcriptional regulator